MCHRAVAAVAQGCAVNEPKDGQGCAVMSRKDGWKKCSCIFHTSHIHVGRISQGAMDGGAINEPKDG
jgi:hypothetical protein